MCRGKIWPSSPSGLGPTWLALSLAQGLGNPGSVTFPMAIGGPGTPQTLSRSPRGLTSNHMVRAATQTDRTFLLVTGLLSFRSPELLAAVGQSEY